MADEVVGQFYAQFLREGIGGIASRTVGIPVPMPHTNVWGSPHGQSLTRQDWLLSDNPFGTWSYKPGEVARAAGKSAHRGLSEFGIFPPSKPAEQQATTTTTTVPTTSVGATATGLADTSTDSSFTEDVSHYIDDEEEGGSGGETDIEDTGPLTFEHYRDRTPKEEPRGQTLEEIAAESRAVSEAFEEGLGRAEILTREEEDYIAGEAGGLKTAEARAFRAQLVEQARREREDIILRGGERLLTPEAQARRAQEQAKKPSPISHSYYQTNFSFLGRPGQFSTSSLPIPPLPSSVTTRRGSRGGKPKPSVKEEKKKGE